MKKCLFFTQKCDRIYSWREIIYIEGEDNICRIYLADGRRLNSVRHLGHYRQMLKDNPRFFQVSKSLVINLNHLIRYHALEQVVELACGFKVDASRRGGSALMNYLKNGDQE
ncbi:MAG: LytTR family transcriptional regulator DNA-binding domain-containing protein [Saprospiraceae bacterium]|nr:LytTR family transcriptional regulator DNA-binding domain-containing protein [Saprospiraceae bacterium]